MTTTTTRTIRRNLSWSEAVELIMSRGISRAAARKAVQCAEDRGTFNGRHYSVSMQMSAEDLFTVSVW